MYLHIYMTIICYCHLSNSKSAPPHGDQWGPGKDRKDVSLNLGESPELQKILNKIQEKGDKCKC